MKTPHGINVLPTEKIDGQLTISWPSTNNDHKEILQKEKLLKRHIYKS